MLITGRPDLDPPGSAEGQGLCNNIKHEDECPKGNPSCCLEISDIDASLYTPSLALFILDQLLRRRLVRLSGRTIGCVIRSCLVRWILVMLFCLLLGSLEKWSAKAIAEYFEELEEE